MVRLFKFALFGGLGYFVMDGLSRFLRRPIDGHTLAVAAITAGVVGFLSFMFDKWIGEGASPFHPQKVTQETKDTPFKVILVAIGVFVRRVIAFAALVGVVALLAYQLGYLQPVLMLLSEAFGR